MSREAVSHPGIYVRGATTAITRRTTLRKAFLAPWHELVEQSWLYSLGDAQQHTGVAIHGSNVVIDHHHTEVTAPDGPALVEFTRRVHVDMSKAINTLLSELRYDAPGEVWDDRPPHRMRLVDAAAQISHHVYGQLNSTAAGLVARPDQMPMTALSQRHWKGGPLVIDRPPVMFDPRTRPAQVEVWVSPEPLAFELFDGELDALIHHLDRLCERGWRRIRDARRGRRPMGAKAVRRIHPWNEPRTLRETRGQPVRTFKVGARGIVGVNRYAKQEEDGIAILRISEEIEAVQHRVLAGLRMMRDESAVAAALSALQAGAAGTANLMELIVEAARVRATEGEIVTTLKEVFGDYREPSWV